MKTQTASVTGGLRLSYCQLHGQEPAGGGCSPAQGQGDSATRAPIPELCNLLSDKPGFPPRPPGESSHVVPTLRTQSLDL